MALPDVVITIQDPALGVSVPDTSRQQAKVGTCSLLSTGVYVFGDANTAKTTLGAGPLLDAVLDTILKTGQPVVVSVAASDVAGVVGSVTEVGTGTGVVAFTGTPVDSYEIQIKIIQGGTTLASGITFQYSLDGGRSWSATITGVASYVVPNTGLTLTMTNGSGTSWVAGDVYSAAATAPTMTDTAMTTAINNLLAQPYNWFMCHVVGLTASVATAATRLSALDAIATTMAAAYRYAYFQMDLPYDTDANIVSAFSAVVAASKRIMVTAGFVVMASQQTPGLYPKRPIGFAVATRQSAISPQTEPGRFDLGPLSGVTLPANTTGYRDERVSPVLDAINITTVRTYVGVAGVYITRGRLKSAVGSDYQRSANRRVMDIASQAMRVASLQLLESDVRVKSDGTLLEVSARSIDAQLGQALANAVVAPGYATASNVVCSRTDNILSTATLNVAATVRPRGYLESINEVIGFENPALAAA